MSRIRYGIALTAACAAVLLAGCSGGARMSSDSAPQADSAGRQSRPVKQPLAEGKGGVVSGVKVTPQERQVIYTGTMTVRAKRVAAAVQQAKLIVTGAGGYLSREDSSSDGDIEDRATLEFKVPPAKYGQVTARLGKELGSQLSMSQGTQDVTLEVADVNSRVKSAEQSLESLRTLLKRAGTIGQVLDVEREISTRESDLESLQARQKELAGQVAMATLTVQLVGPVAVVDDPGDEPAGFLGGLEAGWSALVSFTRVTLTVLGASLPWLIFVSPFVALTVFLARRNRARRPVPPRSEVV
ncbi:DUF4349 domain-containing protein [Nonomuraea sp. NPDC046802]|uniref:DUF4349 domain-containing protein n=1 Tax=Nonomuraea sp. NPDC046802 TaxID=3154919 RepID=UPI0033FAC5BC